MELNDFSSEIIDLEHSLNILRKAWRDDVGRSFCWINDNIENYTRRISSCQYNADMAHSAVKANYSQNNVEVSIDTLVRKVMQV